MENIENEGMTSSSNSDDEISLLDLIAVLLRYKFMIIITCAVAMVAVVVFSVISIVLPPETSPYPNKYTPSATMLIKESSSGGGGMAAALSASGLASLAGINMSTGFSNSSFATYLVSSNLLLDAVTDKFGIIEKYEIEKSPRASSREILKKVLVSNYDEETGVFSVSFTDIDPVFAQSVVDFVVDWIEDKFTELNLDSNKIQKENLERNIQSSFNEIVRLEQEIQRIGASVNSTSSAWNLQSISMDVTKVELELSAQKQVYSQLKTQYELLKVEMQSETPIFQVIERPEVPDRKSGPSRGMLCVIVSFAAFFISVFLAFALNAYENIKNDEEAVKKLGLKPRKK